MASLALSTCTDQLDRETYLSAISTAGCARLETCGNIGEGGTYLNQAECVENLGAFFADLWPSGRCSTDEIDDAAFSSCETSLDSFPCDSQFLESELLLRLCGPEKVCGASEGAT